MKKVVFKLSLVALVIVGIFYSCKKNVNMDTLKEDLENKEFIGDGIDKVFDKISQIKVSQLKDSQNNAIYVDYKWDSKNKIFIIEKIEEREMDIIPIMSKQIDNNIESKSGYEVYCEIKDENGNTLENWQKPCDGKWSCGSIIYECLENGGCATICNSRMMYVPQLRTFILRV